MSNLKQFMKDAPPLIRIPAGQVTIEVAKEGGSKRTITVTSSNILEALDKLFPTRIELPSGKEE